MKLCIYRTENGCGWGVKTLENIKKGSFVVEYVGEVISNEEAEERGKKYGKTRKPALRVFLAPPEGLMTFLSSLYHA